MGEGTGTNKCGCDTKFADDHESAPCTKTDCPKCYSCCGPGCSGCIILCRNVKDDVCKCRLCDCGCQKLEKGKPCKDSNCQRCKKICKEGTTRENCKCYLCNCGCNGVNCQCCRWCNPVTKCNGTCDRETKHSPKCTGKKEGEECGRDNVGKFYCMEHKDKDGCEIGKGCKLIFYATGGCRFKCTHCGKLCAQDICRIWLGVIIIVSLILSSLFVTRRLYPEKFQAVMAKIRPTFSSSSRSTAISLSNLVEKIPDVNIDRYPAFRPRTYAGFA